MYAPIVEWPTAPEYPRVRRPTPNPYDPNNHTVRYPKKKPVLIPTWPRMDAFQRRFEYPEYPGPKPTIPWQPIPGRRALAQKVLAMERQAERQQSLRQLWGEVIDKAVKSHRLLVRPATPAPIYVTPHYPEPAPSTAPHTADSSKEDSTWERYKVNEM